MSRLRPECGSSNKQPIYGGNRIAILRDVYKSVARRRSLAFGVLDDDDAGKHCAMGCFWEDNIACPIPENIVDEVAAINDSVPADATPKQRWDTVMNWLRIQLGQQV